jgi:integrase
VEENAVKVGGEVHVGTPKTHEKRSVPYPRFLDGPIRELLANRGTTDLLLGRGLAHLRTPHSVTGWFVMAVKRAQDIDPDFPTITPHDLRHTAASLAISAGANVKAVQRMLGHASAAMTLDTYADLFEDDLDDVSIRLNQMREETFVGFL